MSEYFIQQKFKTRNAQKEKAEQLKKERAVVGSSQELPKTNVSEGNLSVKAPLLTDRDIPYYNSYQSPKQADHSLYQIMQALNKNTTKSTQYLSNVQPKNENISLHMNRSKSPQQPAKSKQQPNTSYSSMLEFIKQPSLHKPTHSAIQTSQDRYNLTSTSQEISKKILQNLRQTKNKSDLQVKQIDSGSFIVNKLEQEKLNCHMCYRKDTQLIKNQNKPQNLAKEDRNLSICRLESIKIQLTDENDLASQLLNINSQLTNKLSQLKKLYDFKDKEWRQQVIELKNELEQLISKFNQQQQSLDKKEQMAQPKCLKNCEALLQGTPVDIQFENLMNQANQQSSNKYEKMLKDMYQKLQIQNNADIILKQLSQSGKQSERTYLKLIEDLRQKYNKQQKIIQDSQTIICDQNSKLVQAQECIKLIQELISNSENLKNFRLKKLSDQIDFDDVLSILQQLDAKIVQDGQKREELEQIVIFLREEKDLEENKLNKEIMQLRETIDAIEKKSFDPVKQRISLSATLEEQNVLKELAMIILSKSMEGDIQDRVASILRRTYGDLINKNELLIQDLQQKTILLSKQLEFEKELTQTLKKQLNHFYEKFLLISKVDLKLVISIQSFDCIPQRVLENNEVLQVAAKTIQQAKPLIIQEYVEMQSTQSDQEDELLTRQSITNEDPNNSKVMQRAGNLSTKSFSNYFSPKNKEDDFYYMLLLQAITIEEYVYQTNESSQLDIQTVQQQPQHQQLRPQFSFNYKDKSD